MVDLQNYSGRYEGIYYNIHNQSFKFRGKGTRFLWLTSRLNQNKTGSFQNNPLFSLY
ncbi:hypothetical protein CW3_2888 [Bacteroides xylanisolvens SD CC 1b]|nr:hypothetical protein CW3_2888 [Bacteroides xylanisolvens SD CC 1b]CDL99941.1 hypothetical protein BN891_28580 [Bacteroides xylanisolvens SD CC 2a]